MEHVDTPVLICWVLRVTIEELLYELVLLPNVDRIGDVPALILVREPTINDSKAVHYITIFSSQ